jgi:hypothetical protein
MAFAVYNISGYKALPGPQCTHLIMDGSNHSLASLDSLEGEKLISHLCGALYSIEENETGLNQEGTNIRQGITHLEFRNYQYLTNKALNFTKLFPLLKTITFSDCRILVTKHDYESEQSSFYWARKLWGENQCPIESVCLGENVTAEFEESVEEYAKQMEEYAKNEENFDDECSICLKPLAEMENVQVEKTSCGHYFHDHCLAEWTKVTPNCPVCRANVACGSSSSYSSKKLETHTKLQKALVKDIAAISLNGVQTFNEANGFVRACMKNDEEHRRRFTIKKTTIQKFKNRRKKSKHA